MGRLAALWALALLCAASPAGAADPPREQRPYSCRLYDDEQRKCAFGQCDARTIARLGQPDGISRSRMAEMLEVDKAGPKVRC
jgi:hypothetical protein